jgi:hypothetical protein
MSINMVYCGLQRPWNRPDAEFLPGCQEGGYQRAQEIIKREEK